MPTFWLSRHSRCLKDYQALERVRQAGNPGFYAGPLLILILQWRSPFFLHPVGANQRTAYKRPRATGFPLPAASFSTEVDHAKSPGLVTGKLPL